MHWIDRGGDAGMDFDDAILNGMLIIESRVDQCSTLILIDAE